MNPEDVYFVVDIEYPRAALAEVVYGIKDWDGYTPPTWDPSRYDPSMFNAVSHRYKETMNQIQAINETKKLINMDFTYKDTQLVCFPPNHGPLRHRDVERQTAMLFPIWTHEEYVPIDFWDNNKEHAFSVDYRNQVIVFDAKVLHSIANKQDFRYSLQFDIQLPFSEIKQLHANGKLFRDLEQSVP